MRFHCLLPVRDEADIIGQCLEKLLSWADTISILDTGSVDNTWEIVQEYAAKDRRVRPLRKEPVFYSENRVRGWLFDRARVDMEDGDWFLRVDADEFHHIPPPEFVRTRLRKHETVVWHQYYDFRLTAAEVARWDSGAEGVADRSRPIAERRHYYTISDYSEPRLCRYRRSMCWPVTASFPFNAGFVARERLPIRHYPHRDPQQLMRRCQLRAIMMADATNRSHWTHPELHHWAQREWRKFITPDDLQGLRHWAPGAELARSDFHSHLSKGTRRLVQRLVHACCLPLLDRCRDTWRANDFPQQIPPELQAELERIFKSCKEN